MTKRNVCTATSRNTSSWGYPVDFDGRREMSSLSLKTVMVHKSVTALMTGKNLQKGGLVHRVPRTKSWEKLQELFQSTCALFCKYKHCNLFLHLASSVDVSKRKELSSMMTYLVPKKSFASIVRKMKMEKKLDLHLIA